MTRREKIAGWVLGVLLFAGIGFLLYSAFLSGNTMFGVGEEIEDVEAFPEDIEGEPVPEAAEPEEEEVPEVEEEEAETPQKANP